MKSLFLIPMTISALLLSSCATHKASCGKCGKPGCCEMCAKPGGCKADCKCCKGS